jgi:chloramphenicol 3-O phosphotransferase
LFEELTRAVCASAAALARSSFDVVVDTVFERPICADICSESFAGFNVSVIGLTCSLHVLDSRERARGDRPSGLARRQAHYVHEAGRYRMMLDTSARDIETCAREVQNAMRAPQNPS